MDELSGLSTPIGSISFASPAERRMAAEKAALARAYGMLPSMLRGVSDTETIRAARREPTLRFEVQGEESQPGRPLSSFPGRFFDPTETEGVPESIQRILAPEGAPSGDVKVRGYPLIDQEFPPPPTLEEQGEEELRAFGRMRPVPGTVETAPADVRSFQRMPTALEAFDRLRSTTELDDATKAALVHLVTGARLPSDRDLPADVERARTKEATVQALLTSGRAKTLEEAETIAQATSVTGVKPAFETLLPRRLTPSERLKEDAAARDQKFQERIDAGEFDLARPAGAREAMNAATAAGAYGVVDQIRKSRGFYREERRAEGEERFVGEVVPGIEKSIAAVGKNQYATPQDVDSLQSRLETARADPSSRNVADLNAEIGRVSRSLVQREQFAKRMDLLESKLAQARERATTAIKDKNLAAAESNVKFMVSNIDREIARLTRDMYLVDPQTQASMAHTIDQLERRKEGFQSWLDEVTRSRSQTKGTDIDPRPPMTIPPIPESRAPEQKGERSGAAREQYKDLLK